MIKPPALGEHSSAKAELERYLSESTEGKINCSVQFWCDRQLFPTIPPVGCGVGSYIDPCLTGIIESFFSYVAI